MGSRSTFNFQVIDDADVVYYPCGECGHARASHEGHTHPPGTTELTHCSQCKCQEYRPKRLPRATRKFSVAFSRRELIHLRRFLNRAVECCEGRCPGYPVHVWYYVKPLLKKIEASLREDATNGQ